MEELNNFSNLLTLPSIIPAEELFYRATQTLLKVANQTS